MHFMWGKTVIVGIDGVARLGLVRKVFTLNGEETYQIDMGDETINVSASDSEIAIEPINTYDTISLDFLSGDVVAVGTYNEDGELEEVTLREDKLIEDLDSDMEFLNNEHYTDEELDSIGYVFDKTNDRREIEQAIDEMLDKLGDLMYTEEVVGVCDYTRSSKNEIKNELEGLVGFIQ